MAKIINLTEEYFRRQKKRPWHFKCGFTVDFFTEIPNPDYGVYQNEEENVAQTLVGATIRFVIGTKRGLADILDLEKIEGGAGSTNLTFPSAAGGNARFSVAPADALTPTYPAAKRGYWYQFFVKLVGTSRVVWFEGELDVLEAPDVSSAVDVAA